jgi:hypothetical protein
MEVTVTDYIHVRIGNPSVNAPTYQYLAPGSKLTVEEKLYSGDAYEGNNQWLKDAANNYYWSGGVDLKKPVAPPKQFKFPPPPPIVYWDEINALGVPQNKGNNVKVAVLDTGIETHPDLPLPPSASIDSTGSNDASDQSPVGHGTHVAGIIGARSTFPNGIIGVAPACELYSYKVNPGNRPITGKFLVNALSHLIQQNVRIVNMSFALSERQWKNDPDTPSVETLMRQAVSGGIIIFAASGDNQELETRQFPACLDMCISVGGFDGSFKPSIVKTKYPINFISYAHPYYSCNTGRNGYYLPLPGASMNTAFFSGIAARIISDMQSNGMTVNQATVLSALEKYAVNLNDLNTKVKDYKFSIFRT